MPSFQRLLSSIVSLLLIVSCFSDTRKNQNLRRRLEEGTTMAVSTDSCALRTIKEIPAVPSWTASFPGSGGKLLWQIVEQITGIATTDDFDTLQRLSKKNCIAVKTHFPFRQLSPNFLNVNPTLLQHAILLTRNPLDAMISYHKFIYRHTVKEQEAEPTTEAWTRWRDENFNEQIQQWAKLVEWWIDHYNDRLMILRFEDLTTPGRGTETFLQLRMFLSQVDANNAHQFTPSYELDCLWNKMIDTSKGRGYQLETYYTANQLDDVIAAFENLMKTHTSDAHLNYTLRDYLKKIINAKSDLAPLTLI
mmetsp:Transcript_12402/g.19086  ORF Transcript_12402/g.19086 Transcript_12402/m.19086 type:complete len:306 (-) Transcript_12402:50-967(-)